MCLIYGLENITYGFYPIVLPTIFDSNTPNHEYKNLSRMNGRVKSWIFTSASPLVQRGTVTQHWNALENAFSSFSYARVIDICIQLQTIRNNDYIVDDYLMYIKSISDHLIAIGEIFNDYDLILCAIWDLDPCCNALNSYLSMRPSYLTFDEF